MISEEILAWYKSLPRETRLRFQEMMKPCRIALWRRHEVDLVRGDDFVRECNAAAVAVLNIVTGPTNATN